MVKTRIYKYIGGSLFAILMLQRCGEGNDPARFPDTFEFDFEDGIQGWSTGFADYPAGEESRFELESAHSQLPEPLDQTRMALKMSGTNLSDDLFMYAYRQLTGLQPEATYQIIFTLDLASNAPENSAGIGGSPGSSVYIKSGATTEPPSRSLDDQDYYRMDIDKGNQSSGGSDMIVLGHFGTPLEDPVYTILTRTNTSAPFAARTNTAGELWIIVGSDSGFEGTTTVYYDRISVELR